MPCNTIRSTPITFEKVAYKPGHVDLLVAALKAMGFQVADNTPLYRHGTSQYVGDGITFRQPGVAQAGIYRDGKFQIPSTLTGWNFDQLRQQYAAQVIQKTATKHGWHITQTADRQYAVVRR